MPAWLAPAITAAGMGISAMVAKGKDNRQLQQQGKLNSQQIEANQKMLEIQNDAAYDIWQRTGPKGQMEQLQKAGLNAGLMYGMGGAGGQTIGTGSANVGAAKAPAGSGRETEDAIGMGMQLALMKAQKENIEADTEKKRSEVPVNVAREQGMGQENALRAVLMGTDPEGRSIDTGEEVAGGKSTAFQREAQQYKKDEAQTRFTLDENQRQKLMNDATMNKIASEIELMAKEGKKADEIVNNLKKEGKLLELELKWKDWGFNSGDFGKAITGIAHQLVGYYLWKR